MLMPCPWAAINQADGFLPLLDLGQGRQGPKRRQCHRHLDPQSRAQQGFIGRGRTLQIPGRLDLHHHAVPPFVTVDDTHIFGREVSMISVRIAPIPVG